MVRENTQYLGNFEVMHYSSYKHKDLLEKPVRCAGKFVFRYRTLEYWNMVCL